MKNKKTVESAGTNGVRVDAGVSQKHIVKATRQPLHGYGIDWIIEENTGIWLGNIGIGIQTNIYPYNEVFEIEVSG